MAAPRHSGSCRVHFVGQPAVSIGTSREPSDMSMSQSSAVAVSARGMAVRTTLFAFYCLGVTLANFSDPRALARTRRADASASHLVMIPFVSLVLISLRKDAIFSSVDTDWRGFIAIAGGLIYLVTVSCLDKPASGRSFWLRTWLAS